MLTELRALRPDMQVEIVGINRNTDAPYNSLVTDTAHLPWLQDPTTNSVWASWKVVYRDVWILDGLNGSNAVFNLTVHDLSVEANRTALKALFLAAARTPDSDADQLPDDWEQLHFGNLNATREGDPDGDGYDNFTEWALGSNPALAAGTPAWQVNVRPGQGFDVAFRRPAGFRLETQFEVGSAIGPWVPAAFTASELVAPINAADGTGTARTTWRVALDPATVPQAFLRLHAAPRAGP